MVFTLFRECVFVQHVVLKKVVPGIIGGTCAINYRDRKEKNTLDPFDDHMAAVHGNHISVTLNYSRELEGVDTVL